MIFDNIPNRRQAKLKTPTVPMCPEAEQFQAMAAQEYQEIANHPTEIGVNIKLLYLTRKYFQCMTQISKSHRKQYGSQHTCVPSIFEGEGQKLLWLEIRRKERLHFLEPALPQPPAPPPAPKSLSFPAITLGEIVQQEA